MARARGAGDPAAAAILGRLAIDRGSYDDALAVLEPAAKANPIGEAALELGLLQQRLGRATDAVPDARADRERRSRQRHRRRPAACRPGGARPRPDADRQLALPRCRRRAQERPGRQHRLGPAVPREAHAGRSGEVVPPRPRKPTPTGRRPTPASRGRWPTRTRPRLRPLPRGPSRSTRRSLDAHLFVAETALDNDKTDAAKASIDRVLAVNPRSPEAHTLVAAIAWIAGRDAEYEAAVGRALAVNPTRGDTYRVIAAHAARNYRFDEAVALGRKAIALEPGERPGARRAGHAPAAGGRRTRGPARARHRVSRRPVRRRSRSTCCACSTRSTGSTR